MTDRRCYPVDDQTMGGMLRWQAMSRPDETAVVCGDERMSWAELNRRTNRVANALLNHGMQPKQRVAVLMGNCVEYVEIYQALAKIGMAVVPINPQLTAPEIAYILDDCQAETLIYDAARAPLVQQADETDRPAMTRSRIVVGNVDMVDDENSYAGLLAAASDTEPAVTVNGDELFFHGYTSGTTGRPKGCLQRHDMFVAHYKRSFLVYHHAASDVMLIPGPLFHEAPALFTLGQLFFGGTVVVLPEFSADAALATIERERCSIVGFAVPTMLDRIVDCDTSYDVSTVRALITAGAPLHSETMDRVLQRFPDAELHEFYGATELGLVTNTGHRQHRSKGSTTGPPIPGVNVLLLDDADTEVATGEIGQIFVTPVMMDGYHRRPEATAADTREFNGVRWFTLGDLGRLDPDGFLYLVDRTRDMIITGGENVYPAEVESVLLEHPGIADVAVIGLPDRAWGEAVTAVVATPEYPPDADELKTFCENRLAGYKTPKQVLAVDEIPRNPSGKILKHVLREQLVG